MVRTAPTVSCRQRKLNAFRKEVTTMTYAKPEVNLLGDATRLVQAQKAPQQNAEGSLNKVEIGAAYEPEE